MGCDLAMKGNPIELQDAAKELFGTKIDEDKSTEALCHVGRARSTGARVIRFRHLYCQLVIIFLLALRKAFGFVLIRNAAGNTQRTERGVSRFWMNEACISCGAGIFELTVCRDCGQTFVRLSNAKVN